MSRNYSDSLGNNGETRILFGDKSKGTQEKESTALILIRKFLTLTTPIQFKMMEP
jgi:hypothetical protein